MKRLEDVIREHGLTTTLHFHRNNPKAVELAAAGVLTELPSGELWIAGELAGFTLTRAGATDFFHVRKVYDVHRSKVMFCGRVDECVNFVAGVDGEPGRSRSARVVVCRCTGEAPPLEVCQATGELHRWENSSFKVKACEDCGANADDYFSAKGAGGE